MSGYTLRTLACLSMLLAAGAALAEPPTGVVLERKISTDLRVPAQADIRLAPTNAIELGKLEQQVTALQAEVAQLRDTVKQQQGALDLAAAALNSTRTQLTQHTHGYERTRIDFTNRNFVTSGRPIIEQEKKAMGSYINVLTTDALQTGPAKF